MRLENGFQVCWRTASQAFANQAVRTSSFVWPAAFVDAAYVPLITLDRSDPTLLVSAYGRQPAFVQWAARTRDGGNFTGEVPVFAFAVGRWK